jgi:hypothetical protein
MKKVYLYKSAPGPNLIEIQAMGDWAATLPLTKSRNLAYKFGHDVWNVPYIIFTHTQDAVAFKLKFGV